jgi:hypothetical protein
VGVGPIETFGLLMGDAVGFAGFLVLLVLIMLGDSRVFKVNKSGLFLLTGGLVLAEIPFIGSLPSYTVVLWVLFRRQMKVEKAALEKWEKENAQARQQEINQQRAQQIQLLQMQAAQEEEAEFEEQKAADDAQYQFDQEAEQRQVEDATSSRKGVGEAGVTSGVQFETLKDALSELNEKQSRTVDENARLAQAEWIMRHVSIQPNEMNDPVLRAAYERASQGQKVSDGTDETRGGFVFKNLHVFREPKKQPKAPEVTRDSKYREHTESPKELDITP